MKINLVKLSTKDLATLSQRTIAVSEEPAFTVVKYNPILVALKKVYNDYDLLYTKKSFSGKGNMLIEYDNKRDTPFGGLKDILVGYSKISGLPHQQDAKELYAVIERYGIDLDRYKWTEETAQMKKLLEELDKPENAAKIERLQLTSVITQLREAQDAFEKLFIEIAGENSELRMMESATSYRKALEDSLKNYFSLVKAMNSQTGWRELYAKLDEIVKAANNSKPSEKQILPPPPAEK